MEINGYDYKFAYTAGAYCAVRKLNLPAPKYLADQADIIMKYAVILSDAYEKRQKVLDPSYQKHAPLTPELVESLSINDIIDKLSPEVDAAISEGRYREVEAETKNAEGADNE